jgi:hypothetical protein
MRVRGVGDVRQGGGAGSFELPALRSAVLLREGITVDEYRQANRGLTAQFLCSFAAFLLKGRSKFGWDS